ncbi:unnamed protein product [Effrenium voratum]|nr:unnamed protein product [Effrenium voratum]
MRPAWTLERDSPLHYGGRAEESNTDLDHHSHQIYMISNHVPVHEVRLADATKAAGYVILDTACQRLCAGSKWAAAHTERLQNHRLQPVWCPKTEMFEFGKGSPMKSNFAMLFPAFIADSLSIMAPCILEADIPCLASRPMLTTLGAIIDLASNQIYLEAEVQQQASDGDFTDEVHVLKLPSLKPGGGTPDLEPARRFMRALPEEVTTSTSSRSYMNLWALELGVTALLSAGQPAMLLAIGPEGQLKAFLDRAMKVVHWGPTPSRLVASSSVKPGEMESAPAGAPLTQPGVLEVAEVFPRSVRPGAGYNGRDCVDFPRLAEELGRFHGEAARELQMLAKSAFAHQDGRVEEALDGGWVGYAEAEAQLAPGGVLMQLKGPEATAPGPAEAAASEAKPTRRWGRSSPQNGRS